MKGSTVLAFYSFICFFAHFFIHALGIEKLKPLYNYLSTSDPSKLTLISHVEHCTLNPSIGLAVGVVGGLIVGVLVYFLADYGARKGEEMTSKFRHFIALAIFASYMLTFSVMALIADPEILQWDLLLALAVAGVLWLSSSSYVLSYRKRNRFYDYHLELGYISKWIAGLKLSISVGLSAIIALFAAHMLMLYNQYRLLPEVIRSSQYYLSYLFIGSWFFVLLYAGAFTGIVAQRMWTMDKVIGYAHDLDREQRILKIIRTDWLDIQHICSELGIDQKDLVKKSIDELERRRMIEKKQENGKTSYRTSKSIRQ